MDFPDLLKTVTVEQLQRLEIPEPIARQTAARLLERIQAEYGTERVYIPAAAPEARNRAIRAGIASGETAAAVARRIGCSVSTVRRVAARR